MVSNTPALLTPEQTANKLNISEGTLSVWRCTGRYNLPYIKVGRAVRYKESDIEFFINGRTHEHTHS
ncbi:MAG: helix-turn-helix domain-containing protein [gamma proteobacterium symbiont of Taylorina sp.]|nr:helix-turn-helix domain-containing protein [gamma proteobacterium symbiont of Taylorina sp.]